MIGEVALQHQEPVLKNQEVEEEEIVNIDDFINFDDFSGVFLSDLFKDNDDDNNKTSSSESSSSPSSCVEQGSESSERSIWIRQIEEMLLSEDDGENNVQQGFSTCVEDDFFADLDFPLFQQQQQEEPQFLQFSDQPACPENSTPENENCSADKEGTSDSSEEVNEKKRSHESDDNEDNEDDDPITKKRKRQMRNRDAAVRSRERKKLYVKDLEMKSKYLEGECIRLQRLLQYCTAENHALHLQLQEKAIAASRTMQESAVLLLESLLLGSLLWFLAMVVSLFSPLEMLLKQQLPARSVVVVSAGSNNQRVVALERATSKKRVGIGTINKCGKAFMSKMRDVVGCYAAAAAAAAAA